jgi:AraC family transcriptional activator of pobA
MAKQNFPTFGIDHLAANKSDNGLLNADRFSEYLSGNPHLHSVHRHSFYHLLYFTEGKGEHVIDFVKFPVKKGMIYFMKPGQVHGWDFKGNVDGYIINFSPTFLDQLLLSSNLLDQFSFFGSDVEKQVMVLSKSVQEKVVQIFEKIVGEQYAQKTNSQMMIASLMLQLFLTVSRSTVQKNEYTSPTYNSVILTNFEKLIEENYKQLKLPKEYAGLLYITPNHLNALCKDVLGISAGEMIRNRIVLEAKRLLVNFKLSISEIAVELNFKDNSYFVKFFKKYTKTTPEQFRKLHYT